MAGSSIAAPGAVAWVTDFLNAAYYARPEPGRDVRDLRLAHGIITTRWAHGRGGRLGARDVVALNRAYGATRLRNRGRLEHDALLHGARTLIGDWFPAAWGDERRRAYGIAFRTDAERDAFTPKRRLARAALGPLTPPIRPPAEQRWATYDPVLLPDAQSALTLLLDPPRWPDIGTAAGRFTPVRDGGLLDQTFEIEVVASPAPRSPVFTRGYVTCTTALTRTGTPGADHALDRAVDGLRRRYVAGAGPDAGGSLPEDAEPLALVVLTTHEGHFLGRALSQLLMWRDDVGTWVRDVGAWDPLTMHLAAAYAAAGRAAQHQFWGPAPASRSMLAQLALVSCASG